jgi:hypothetical protein
METNTNNVNKTWAYLQAAGGKDEPIIVFNAYSSCVPYVASFSGLSIFDRPFGIL